MVSVNKYILFAFVGSVLLTGVLAFDADQIRAHAEGTAQGAIDGAEGFARATGDLASNTVGSFTGLGSKIISSVRRGAAAVYSHIPFLGRTQKKEQQPHEESTTEKPAPAEQQQGSEQTEKPAEEQKPEEHEQQPEQKDQPQQEQQAEEQQKTEAKPEQQPSESAGQQDSNQASAPQEPENNSQQPEGNVAEPKAEEKKE